ncbi:MAG: hypothetical protein CSA82_02145 [Actinobacteria bacterium]|nr:MAG: hypothetical protein CSA82_02145 [Actinomycetota bacterium]
MPLPSPLPPQRPSLTMPIILLVAGCVVFFGTLIAAIVGGTYGVNALIATTKLTPLASTTSQTEVLPASTSYTLYADSPPADCTVIGPAGEDITVRSDAAISSNFNGHYSFASFTTNAAGKYTISCHTEDITAGVYFAESIDPSGFVGGILGFVGGVFLAIVLVLVSIGLLIGGGVQLALRLRERRTYDKWHQGTIGGLAA